MVLVIICRPNVIFDLDTFERKHMRSDFNGYPHIINHARQKLFHFRFPLPCVADICDPVLPMSGRDPSAISKSAWSIMWGRRWIASPSVSVQSYFHFRFHGRHCGFEMSVYVGQCRQFHIPVGAAENMALAYRMRRYVFQFKLCVHACLASAHLEIRMSPTCHWPFLRTCGLFSPVLSGQLFWAKAIVFRRLWALLSKCNILKKCHFLGFSLLRSVTWPEMWISYMPREGSSRWTQRYITLADPLPNKKS